MSTWPAYARPVPPVGDAELQAVIIGNLHDPNTAYENAQIMAQAFPQGYRAKIGGQKHLVCGTVWTPAGYLVTWQGYGHCLKVLKHATALLKAYNASKKSETLPEYTNAVAKYACMSKILSYLDTGKGIQDGHTCLVPEPLSLGKAAAAKTWQNAQNANKDDYDADDWLQQKMRQLWTRSLGFQWNDQKHVFFLCFWVFKAFGHVSIYIYITCVHMYVWFYISVLVAVSISSIHCVQVFWKVNLFYHSGALELKKPSPTFLFPLQVPFLEAASFPAGCLFPGCFQPQLFLWEKRGFAPRISVVCWSLWMVNASQKIVIKRWLWRLSRWELVRVCSAWLLALISWKAKEGQSNSDI